MKGLMMQRENERAEIMQKYNKLLIEKAKLERELGISSRYNLKKLRLAVDVGPLKKGECLSTELIFFSRLWRRLLADLKDPAYRCEAECALTALNINYVKAGTNGKKFFIF